MTYAIHSGILGVPCFLLLSVHRPSYQDPHNSSLHSSLKSFRRVWDRGSSDFFWKVSVASTGHSLRKDAGSQEGNAKLSELGPTTLQEKSLHCSSQWSSSNFAGGGGSCNIEAASGERLVREMQEWRCKMLGPSPSACKSILDWQTQEDEKMERDQYSSQSLQVQSQMPTFPGPKSSSSSWIYDLSFFSLLRSFPIQCLVLGDSEIAQMKLMMWCYIPRSLWQDSIACRASSKVFFVCIFYFQV